MFWICLLLAIIFAVGIILSRKYKKTKLMIIFIILLCMAAACCVGILLITYCFSKWEF